MTRKRRLKMMYKILALIILFPLGLKAQVIGFHNYNHVYKCVINNLGVAAFDLSPNDIELKASEGELVLSDSTSYHSLLYTWAITDDVSEAFVYVINKKEQDTLTYIYRVLDIPTPNGIMLHTAFQDTLFVSKNTPMRRRILIPKNPDINHHVVCKVANFSVRIGNEVIDVEGGYINDIAFEKILENVGQYMQLENIYINCPCYTKPKLSGIVRKLFIKYDDEYGTDNLLIRGG